MSSTNVFAGGILNPWQIAIHTAIGTGFAAASCYTNSWKAHTVTEPGYIKTALPYAVDTIVIFNSLYNPAQAAENLPKAMQAIQVATTTLRSVVIADQYTKLVIDGADTMLLGGHETELSFE